MRENLFTRQHIIIICILALVYFVAMLLLLFVPVNISIDCYAVDNEGLLYVAARDNIYVIEEGRMIREIEPGTSRGYMFTINEENVLIISTASVAKEVDLSGHVINEFEDKGASIYNSIQYKMFGKQEINGDTYTVQGLLGRTRIVKNDREILYQITPLSVVVKYALIICAVFMAAMILYGLAHRTGNGSLSWG